MRPNRVVNASDVLLLVLRASGGEVKSKTVLQKLAYFVAARSGLDLNFEPYYYGPFSRDAESAMELLVLRGAVEETETYLGTNVRGLPVKQVKYQLTREGTAEAEAVASQAPEPVEAAERVVQASRETHTIESPQRISLAAKVHYIRDQGDVTPTAEEIERRSRAFGWKVDSDDARGASDLLERIRLNHS
jgi:uncharacterized protein YwgA